MTYSVKSCFRTIQGEGARAGRVALFCRFAGCNLWSGLEKDQRAATCRFCDTDFVGTDGTHGGRFDSAAKLASHILAVWGDGLLVDNDRYVVFTGGEPLLQLDMPLIDACHECGFEVAVETNGTLPCPNSIDWICVSPKAGTQLRQRSGDELKLVYPQAGVDPGVFEAFNFKYLSLQPLDDSNREDNTQSCVAYCLAHPRWRLSLQIHKLIGIP